jgi:outer membrane receptor protein involved in Fe transport
MRVVRPETRRGGDLPAFWFPPPGDSIQLTAQPIRAAYAYNETRIVADPVYPVRNTFQNAPRHSGSVWAVYRLATALTELC